MGSHLDVILIRHGLTAYNAEKRYLGHLDLPLILEGERQINQMRSSCSDFEVEQVFSSDLTRCLQTASLLFPTSNIHVESKLREYDFGDWEGKRYEDLMDQLFYRAWIDDPIANKPPNAEGFEHFSSRVLAGFWNCLRSIEEQNDSMVVIVAHGGVIREILTKLAPSSKSFFEWKVNIGSLYHLRGEMFELRRGGRFNSLQVVPITEKTNG
ncbi:histidine phosphatase family protein [Bacillus sp. FJAT-45037]|uniref:histidine phosphatase family protein n=1 Tax=Bacillus sp. FJAT-45037 TaxID=2011007 RepID=UPI000C234258|nr:histidine phosphatase family protein [Bacillus sp. FJAT-45037]